MLFFDFSQIKAIAVQSKAFAYNRYNCFSLTIGNQISNVNAYNYL